jgi:cyclophilin family peptidyl-prolyl cis-trans isomerase
MKTKSALAVGLSVAVVAVVAASGFSPPSTALRAAASLANGRISQAPVPSVIVVETAKGSFTVQTFPHDAPKTVAHIVALVQRGFYDGQRVHRALAGFVVQFGDPQTKDLEKRDLWGLGAAASSGTPVGAAEIAPLRTHVAGAVGLAHIGEPAQGDSQIYITLAARHDLDGKYAVFGQVVGGADVPAQLQVGDLITRAYIRE